MLPTVNNYRVYPAVVKADAETAMTLAAAERAFFFFEDEEYTLTLIAVDGDELDYHEPVTHRKITVKAHEGVLRFSCAFSGEGAHIIFIHKGEKKLGEVNLYALKEDLYALMPYRADFHTHSFRSDGKRDPAALAGHFREQGYDLFALTDHNRYYPGGEIDEAYEGLSLGISRVKGEEVHAPGCVAHIVHVLGERSVAEDYLADMEGYQKEVAEKYLPRVPADVPEEYRERYAIASWVTDRIHAAGGLAIFPHPYWRPNPSRVYNVRNELARILLKSGMFDAYELVGGMKQDGVNISVALWQELVSARYDIPIVGSSDVHGVNGSANFPNYFTLCFAESKDPSHIKKAILERNTVAVEATGYEYQREYRAYGKHRLVAYAQFLFAHFFPHYQRLAQGEGVAMRAYAMGEAPAALVTMQAALAEEYRARFFGRKAPVLPTKDMLAFEDKWRARHMEGPDTKGSSLFTGVVTRQI